MLTRFTTWIIGRSAKPPTPPDGIALSAPRDDVTPIAQAIPSLAEREEEGPYEDLFGTSWVIAYTDAQGDESTRRITVLGAKIGKGGDRTIMAKCHERNGIRQFRIDRITELMNIATGEIIEPPTKVFGAARIDMPAPDPRLKEHERVMRAARDPLRVLLFVARADGRVCHDEMDAMLRIVDDIALTETARGPLWYDADKVTDWIAKQTPDAAVAAVALGRMAELAPPARLKSFRRSMEKLVTADGVVHPAETEAMIWLDEEIEAAAARWKGRTAEL